MGAGADDRRKHPAVAGAGGAGGVLLSGLMFPGGVGAGVPVVACLRFFL